MQARLSTPVALLRGCRNGLRTQPNWHGLRWTVNRLTAPQWSKRLTSAALNRTCAALGKTKAIIAIAAWIMAAGIVYGTLGRVGLPYGIYFKLAPWLGHPSMHEYAVVEHVLVFALIGALLCFAYPDRIIPICCIIGFSAVLLEALQTLTPDRHGTILDACQKVVGGLLGVFATHAVMRWNSSRRRRSRS